MSVGPPGISIAFDDDALEDSPTWTRVDTQAGIMVESITVDRGRADERSKTIPGTVTVTGYDTLGASDPTNSSGPWFGKMDPTKQAAVTIYNPITAQWNYVFRGHTAEFFYEVDASEKFAKFEWQFVDLLDLLNDAEVIPDGAGNFAPGESVGDCYYTGQHCDDRQFAVLADTATSFLGTIWPVDLLEIASGNVYVQGVAYGRNTSMLQVIDEACDAEGPSSTNRFATKDGSYRFTGRYYRYTPDLFSAADDASRRPNHRLVKWAVGDLPSYELDNTLAVAATPFRIQRGKTNLINTALCTPQGIPTNKIGAQTHSDPGSIAKYGVRTGGMSLENLKVSQGDDGNNYIEEAESYGEVIVANYKDPVTRVPQMTFKNPQGDITLQTNVWALLSGIELSDLVTVHTHHPGGGGLAGVDHFVEKIHYDIKQLQGLEQLITLTLDLSPRAYYAHTASSWKVPDGTSLSADFTYTQPGGLGTSVANFTDTSIVGSFGPIVSWAWDFGDGTTSALQNPTHNFGSTGLYSVQLVVTDSAAHTSKTIIGVILP